MAIIVEHEKRRKEILDKALDVFAEEGYADVTFQKIADRCGITRTTLYIYFKNKHEIFLWSIKQLTASLEKNLVAILNNKTLSAESCLVEVLMSVMDACEENKRLFGVILVYLLQAKKSGVDPGDRVRRRVIRIHHLLNVILIRGMKDGEFKRLDVGVAEDLIYSLIESAVFRLAILGNSRIPEVRANISFVIKKMLILHAE